MQQQLDDWANWNYQTVCRIVTTHEYEPGWFDYKSVLNATTQHHTHNRRLCHAVAALANTDGGYIVFGVVDRQDMPHATDPLERIVGIPHATNAAQECSQKLAVIDPNVDWEPIPAPIPLPQDPTRAIFVIRVPRSARRPHAVEGTFYARSPGGTAQPMATQQVRDQILYTEERLRRLTLLRLEIAGFRALVERMLAQPRLAATVHRFDNTTFKSALADVAPLLPSRGVLLGMLMRLGQSLGQINQTLEKSGVPPQGAPMDAQLAQILAVVEDHCADCEMMLGWYFGPLVSPPHIIVDMGAFAQYEVPAEQMAAFESLGEDLMAFSTVDEYIALMIKRFPAIPEAEIRANSELMLPLVANYRRMVTRQVVVP